MLIGIGSVRGVRRGAPFVLGGAQALEAACLPACLGALPPGWPTTRQRLPQACLDRLKIVKTKQKKQKQKETKITATDPLKDRRNPTSRRG